MFNHLGIKPLHHTNTAMFYYNFSATYFAYQTTYNKNVPKRMSEILKGIDTQI